VLVVDDSASQRMRLIGWLESDPQLEVVGWAASGLDALKQASALKPDLVIMDLRMPVMDGIDATRRIMEECPTPVVMVTASAPPRAPAVCRRGLRRRGAGDSADAGSRAGREGDGARAAAHREGHVSGRGDPAAMAR